MVSVESVQAKLDKHKNLLTFEETGDYIVIRLKHYVPKEKWDEIHADVENIGGKYVGGIGNKVHWRVSRQQEVKQKPAIAVIPCPHCGKPFSMTIAKEAS